MDDFIMVRSHPDMLQYVDKLQRQNAEALSFYPLSVIEREIANGRVIVGVLNGEPCGYLYHGSSSDGCVRCHQVCVPVDARRRLYGAALVCAVEEWGIRRGATSIRLRCGFDLDATSFWLSLGYVCIRIDTGGIRRMRKINVFEKHISPLLFDVGAIEPAVGKTSATVWAKHKQTGIVTQFARGKALAEYRATVLTAHREQDDKVRAGTGGT